MLGGRYFDNGLVGYHPKGRTEVNSPFSRGCGVDGLYDLKGPLIGLGVSGRKGGKSGDGGLVRHAPARERLPDRRILHAKVPQRYPRGSMRQRGSQMIEHRDAVEQPDVMQ